MNTNSTAASIFRRRGVPSGNSTLAGIQQRQRAAQDPLMPAEGLNVNNEGAYRRATGLRKLAAIENNTGLDFGLGGPEARQPLFFSSRFPRR